MPQGQCWAHSSVFFVWRGSRVPRIVHYALNSQPFPRTALPRLLPLLYSHSTPQWSSSPSRPLLFLALCLVHLWTLHPTPGHSHSNFHTKLQHAVYLSISPNQTASAKDGQRCLLAYQAIYKLSICENSEAWVSPFLPGSDAQPHGALLDSVFQPDRELLNTRVASLPISWCLILFLGQWAKNICLLSRYIDRPR